MSQKKAPGGAEKIRNKNKKLLLKSAKNCHKVNDLFKKQNDKQLDSCTVAENNIEAEVNINNVNNKSDKNFEVNNNLESDYKLKSNNSILFINQKNNS